MAAVAFANSVRDACPACAQAPGAADDRIRVVASASLAFHPIAGRPSPAPLPMLRQARRTRFGSMWNFPAGGAAAREPLSFCIRNGEKRDPGHSAAVGSIMEAPGARWIHHGAKQILPPRRTRRSNRPRQPPARRGSAEAAHEGGAESPDRTGNPRTAPRQADSFFGKNAFPP